MPAEISEPALRRATLLAERLAGRHFAISEIVDDASLWDTALDPERASTRLIRDNHTKLRTAAIEEALWVLIRTARMSSATP